MYALRYKIIRFVEEVSTTGEGSLFRQNGGTDTECSVSQYRYFAYGKGRDQRFLKCSMNTGELQVSVTIGVDTSVFQKQLHQCRLLVVLSFFFL